MSSLPTSGGNPFLKADVVPISVLNETPYQVGKSLKTVVEHMPMSQGFRKAAMEVHVGDNPYVTPAEYAAATGLWLTGVRQDGSPWNDGTIRATSAKHGKILDKFLVEVDGIYLRPTNTKQDEYVQLSNFDFRIVELLARHRRGGAVVKEVSYVVLGHEDEPQRITYSDYSAKLIDRIIGTFPDCCITHSNNGWAKNLLREYASACYGEALQRFKERELYGYHGWEEVGGKMVYLSAAREDCECDCFVPDTPQSQEAEIWRNGLSILDIGRQVIRKDGSLDAYQTYKVSLPFWLYLHMGYASRLFQDAGLNLQFILLIVGRSGSLKTSTCKAFAEPFHPGGMLRLESTPRALELYRESCIDQTMIADDIFAQKGAVMANFEDIIRCFGDEVGRARSCGANYSDIMRTQVRGACIVTAEEPLDSQQSSALRYITLRFETDSIDPNKLRYFQEDQRVSRRTGETSLVQAYFAGWIHFLERNYDKLVAFIETHQPPTLELRFKRHRQIYRAFSAIASMVLLWGKEVGAVEVEEEQLATLWLEIITSLMKQNEEMAIVAEPWQQFLLVLQNSIGTGRVFLANTKEEYEGNSGKFLGYKRLGKDGDCEYVFSPEETYAHVKAQLQSAEKKLIAKPLSIYHELCEHGIAKGYVEQANGRKTRSRYLKRIKLHGHQVEMLVISADAMEECITSIREGAK